MAALRQSSASFRISIKCQAATNFLRTWVACQPLRSTYLFVRRLGFRFFGRATRNPFPKTSLYFRTLHTHNWHRTFSWAQKKYILLERVTYILTAEDLEFHSRRKHLFTYKDVTGEKLKKVRKSALFSREGM